MGLGEKIQIDGVDFIELAFPLDCESFEWLKSESARTGIPADRIASALLRNACYEQIKVGAPDKD